MTTPSAGPRPPAAPRPTAVPVPVRPTRVGNLRLPRTLRSALCTGARRCRG